MRDHGVEYMDARKYICGRVDILQKSAKLCEEVLVLVKFDAEGNVVGIDEAYKYEKSHSGKEHYGKGNEGLLFKKRQIDPNGGEIQKPHEVGNDEVFAKGKEVIYPAA